MTPKELRQFLLEHSQPLLAQYINAATGVREFDPIQDDEARRALFNIVKELILKAPDLLPTTDGLNLSDGDMSARVDSVLTQVGNGTLSPEEAKQLLELLSAGFEMTELTKLMQQLESLQPPDKKALMGK